MKRFNVIIMILRGPKYERSIEVELEAENQFKAGREAMHYAEKLAVLRNYETLQLGSVTSKEEPPNTVVIRIPADFIRVPPPPISLVKEEATKKPIKHHDRH